MMKISASTLPFWEKSDRFLLVSSVSLLDKEGSNDGGMSSEGSIIHFPEMLEFGRDRETKLEGLTSGRGSDA
jgi:hypothetical protein